MSFVARHGSFPTLHILTSLNGKFGTAPLFSCGKIGALSPISVKALRCGGRVPRKNLQCTLMKDIPSAERKER